MEWNGEGLEWSGGLLLTSAPEACHRPLVGILSGVEFRTFAQPKPFVHARKGAPVLLVLWFGKLFQVVRKLPESELHQLCIRLSFVVLQALKVSNLFLVHLTPAFPSYSYFVQFSKSNLTFC